MLAKNNYLDVVYSAESHPKSTYPDKLIDYLIDRFDIKKTDMVLDAGCGNKDFLNAFLNAGIKTVVGVDLYNNGDESIYECNFETDKLPFPDCSFEVVFSKSCLEHLHDPINYLNEIKRVLVPGGKLILMVPDWISCFYLYFSDFSHRQPYTKEAVSDVLSICGYKNISSELFLQLPQVWKYPILKIVCKFLQMFGSPKRIIKNKFLRFSRELMILSSCTRE